MTARGLITVAIALAMVGRAGGRAAAQPQEPVDARAAEARALLDEGNRLFTEDADHEAARARFEASLKLVPSWQALNGIALTHQEQGRHVRAIETYRRLVAEFGGELTPAQRSTVDRRLHALLERVATVELLVVQDGVQIAIDGASLGTGAGPRVVLLMPGTHALIATLDGYRPLADTIEVRAGDTKRLTIELDPEIVVVPVEAPVLARPLPTWVPWATAGAGGALVAVGVLASYAAARDFAAFDDSVTEMAGAPPRPAAGDESQRARGELESRVAVGLYITGGAAIIAGIVMLVRNQPRLVRRDEQSIRLAPVPGGVAITGRF